jgi:hypothetical protein
VLTRSAADLVRAARAEVARVTDAMTDQFSDEEVARLRVLLAGCRDALLTT